MAKIDLEKKYEETIQMAVYHFEEDVVEMYREDCTCFDGETIDWTYHQCLWCKYKAIMNDEFWVRQWSIYLATVIRDLLHSEGE